jgi:hypothetical protein
MTEPVTVRGQLWPTRDRVVQYLDNWVTYVKELEDERRLKEQAYATREAVLSERINELRQEIADTERPLLEKIKELEGERLTLRSVNQSLQQEMDAAVRVLIGAMEVTGSRHSLIVLVHDAIQLAEEGKKIIRENL